VTEEAHSRGLAAVNDTNFILRADDTTNSPAGLYAYGRDSFRVLSKNRYGTLSDSDHTWVLKLSVTLLL